MMGKMGDSADARERIFSSLNEVYSSEVWVLDTVFTDSNYTQTLHTPQANPASVRSHACEQRSSIERKRNRHYRTGMRKE